VTKRDYEVIVVGLGGIGSGAAYWLSRRLGGGVLGLERFEIGHTNGASEDHSRIIRLSYHTPRYVRLAHEAYAAWDDVEREAGERLVVRTGGLDLWPEGAAIPMRDYTASMDECGVAYERLDAGETMRRWPQWHLPRSVQALYQPDGGIAPASACNRAHRRLAREHGATLRGGSPVEAIRSVGGELEVRTPQGAYRCGKVVIAVDSWTNQVIGSFGARLPLTITQEQVVYFAAQDPVRFAPERFPIWIWMDDPCFYGFPMFGAPGPKAAQDVGGREVTPETRTGEADPAALARVRGFVERYLPEAAGPVLELRTCPYTMPPDRDFLLDSVPGEPNALVALGAAHGFKFASLFGRILSELALDGTTRSDISGFEMDRPVLTMADPPKSFLV